MVAVIEPDTIAAISTPPGRGAIGVVRLSGSAVANIARDVIGSLPAPRYAAVRRFRDANGETIDQGLALYFPAPGSFTGEDVLELQAHGGPVLLDMLLARVLELGARMARPGEFTQRAFLNDRMDLVQAEAVADVIEGETAAAVRSAQRSLAGAFSRRIDAIVESLVSLRAYVEAAIDFPEEEIDFLADGEVARRLDAMVRAVAEARRGAEQGRRLKDGLTVVIAGRPNVGKSSLLNRLAGTDAAIVTEVPGTTRDVLHEHIQIDGVPLHVFDTAGLRLTRDPVESEGVARAHDVMARADILLLMTEDGTPDDVGALLSDAARPLPRISIRNKIDLTGGPPAAERTAEGACIRLSVLTGAGMPLLEEELKRFAGQDGSGAENLFIARRRHIEALDRAAEALARAEQALAHDRAGDLVAEDLRASQTALSEITGAVTSEDVLDRIFASFCIGK